MRPRVLWEALGTPGGSRTTKKERPSNEIFALWASRGRFWSHFGVRWGPEGTPKSIILASSRHKWLQKEVQEGVQKRDENGAENGFKT